MTATLLVTINPLETYEAVEEIGDTSFFFLSFFSFPPLSSLDIASFRSFYLDCPSILPFLYRNEPRKIDLVMLVTVRLASFAMANSIVSAFPIVRSKRIYPLCLYMIPI